MSKITITEARRLADQLGRIRAQKATIQAREDVVKSKLLKSGLGSVEGRLFRVVVSCYTQRRIDYPGLIEHLQVSARVLSRFTTEEERRSVKTTSRTGSSKRVST